MSFHMKTCIWMFPITKEWKHPEMPRKWWMNKQNMVYPHSGIFLGNEKDWNIDACYNTDELWKHYDIWKMPVRKGKNTKWSVVEVRLERQTESSVLWMMLMSLDFILRVIRSQWKHFKKDIEVVRFVFSIVPFGSIVDDGLEEIGLEAVGIMWHYHFVGGKRQNCGEHQHIKSRWGNIHCKRMFLKVLIEIHWHQKHWRNLFKM